MTDEIARQYELQNATWGFPIYVMIGGSRKYADDKVEELLGSIHDAKNGPEATTWMNDDIKGCVIWFKDEPTPAIAAHESLHVVAHIFRMIRLYFSEQTEEAYTYLLQWLVHEILEESAQNATWSYTI